MARWTWTGVLLGLFIVTAALLLTATSTDALSITSDTTYKDETIVWTEEVEVSGGAKLTIKNCDVTFRPPASAPLYLRVTSGSLEILDSDLVGEGAGFIVQSHVKSLLRNVTATGLGSVANSSLRARGLPLAAQGGFMFYGAAVTIYNLDISSAPATALYAEDCDLDIFSLGARDACSSYTGTDQCAAVAIVYLGFPWSGAQTLTAELNSSKIQNSKNHGVLVASASTGYGARVSLLGTEISTSSASGLVVYEVNNHENFVVDGDTNEIHHSKGHGISWVRDHASGAAFMDISGSRIYSNEGNALNVVANTATGSADLILDGCTIDDTAGHGTAVTATGCTQSLNVTLLDCDFNACGGSGLYFTTNGDGKSSEYHMILIGSDLDSSGSHGIYAKVTQSYCQFNITLSDTRVVGSRGDGIHVETDLRFFSYLEAPAVTSNISVVDSVISDNRGYGIYDSRYLTSYYAWAQAKSTLHTELDLQGTTFANHTKSAVWVSPTSAIQYCTYSSHAYVGGCTFTNNTGYGYYEKVDSLTQLNGGSTTVGWYFWDSIFQDMTYSGTYIDVRRADLTAVYFHVRGCTFSDLGNHGAVLTTSSTPYTDRLEARLADCSFSDLGAYAYYLWPGRPGAAEYDASVSIKRVKAHNTTGIYVSLDGYSTMDEYDLTLKEVNLTRTRGDAIYITIHPYQSAELVTDIRDIYTYYTNGTALTLSYTSDRNMPLWGQVTGDNITLLTQEVGGLALYEHTGVLTNLTVKNSLDYDLHKVDIRVPTGETGILELHTASMDRKKVTVVGLGSLWVFNELRVSVEWQNGLAALGAGVQIQDREFKVVAVGHVDSEGGMAPVELLAYILDASEFRSRSPFIVNITFLDLEQTGVCSLDEPTTVRIVVHDRVAPSVVVLDPDDGSAQRPTFFELRGSAFDAHAGLYQIRYRLDGGEWVLVGSESPFRTTVEGVEPGPHQLELEVSDRAGNVAREIIHIEIDNQPPRLIVASPDGDVHTRDEVLIVRGETEDGASVSINGKDVDTLHGLFIAEVNLEEGPNTVTVVSMDRLSNVATIRFNATLDTVEPFLDIHSHEDGDWVARLDQTISGLVEEGCVLTINGVAVPVANQSFEHLVQLGHGDNRIVIRAVDTAGNIYTQTLNLHVAIEPPWVHLESPGDGSVHAQREVRVLGTVQPGSIVTVNGRKVTITKGLLDELLILPEGKSTITVEAMDDADNIATVTRQVMVDTIDPVLTLGPLPATTRSRTVAINGNAEGATSLLIDGIVVPMDEEGAFAFNVTLSEGTNVLRLVARDGAGHEDLATVEVVLDTTAPFLRLLLPQMEDDGNGTLWSSEVDLHLRVVSEPGASITLNEVYIIVGEDGTASLDLALDPDGEPLVVRVVAVDDLGNSREQTYTIIYREGAAGTTSLDMGSLLPNVIIIILVVTVVVVSLRYRTLVKKMQRRRRRRPPNSRRPPRGNGIGNGHANGIGNGSDNGASDGNALHGGVGGGELP